MSKIVSLSVVALALALLPAPTPAAPARPRAAAPAAWNPLTFANVLANLPDIYYDPKRLPPKRAFRAALARLERVLPEVVVHSPDAAGAVRLTVNNRSRTFPSAGLKTWIQMGNQLLEVLRWVDSILQDPAAREALQYAAIKGSLKVLDPHTMFYTPQEYRNTKSRFTGSMGGVGLYLSSRGGRIVVRDVLKGGPAARAGVRAGDVLARVDALSMANLNPGIAAERLRGKPGTKVLVEVLRGRRRLRLTLTRTEIVLPSVTTRMLPGRVALITISGFPKNGLAVFQKALTPLRKKRPRAYVLDLRGNEGGYILQAVRMADFFLESGELVKAVGRGGQKVVRWEVKKRADRITQPVVVLINRRTASAAEILAGALSTAGRTLLLGEKTWGKGTVQKLFPMKDGSALKLTMWQYLLRGDIPVQTAAIVPDVELVKVSLEAGEVRYRSAAVSAGEAGQKQAIGAMAGRQPWKGRPVIPRVRYVAGGKAGEDPVLELGRRLVLATKHPTRKGLLAAARPAVAAFGARHGKLILARLKKQGVDWTAAAKPAPTKLVASLSVKHPEVRAGRRVALQLTVTNRGDQPVHRVGATFHSYASMIDGRELLLGRIDPGKSRTASLPVRAPEGIRERWERVRVKVSAQGNGEAAQAGLLLRVHERSRPRLRMHWLVDDRARGNGDGILDPGETASLVVFVQNTGKGGATQTRVDATDATGGLVIAKARALFGKLPAQGVAVSRLTVKLSPRPDPRGLRPGLTITLYDRVLGGDVVQQVKLPRPGAPGKFRAAREVVAPKSDRVRLSGFAGPDAPRVARVTTAARLAVEARRGSWLRVTLPGERFAFLSAADVKRVTGAAAATGVTSSWRVVPPRLELKPGSGVVDRARLTVRGNAFSAVGVRDLWVRVWNPESKHSTVDKISYLAAPPGGIRKLALTARVDLVPGTNYVAVDARDVNGAQGQHRIAVYLPPDKAARPGVSAGGPGAGVAPKKKATKKKRGCGCGQGPAGGGPWLLFTAACLWWSRRLCRTE